MGIVGKLRQSRVLWIAAPLLATALAGSIARAADPDAAETLLASLHPDYRQFIDAVHPLPEGEGARASIYMVLVRPGATDATSRASAPLAGQGARNDILYDPAVLHSDRSAAWRLLLLDHEYFHARHLAGSTSVPLPAGVGAAFERHYFEAAAWGWSVAQARAGRYPGLRENEFREALDRLGDHLRAMRPAGSYAAVSMPTSQLLPADPAPLSAPGR